MMLSRNRQIHLDIGCGLGHFSIAAAKENASHTLIGLEINFNSFLICEDSRRRSNLKNVHFFHTEAYSFISTNVNSNSISFFHIYFPTPYIGQITDHNPIGNSISDRLFSPSFLTEVVRTALPGATLRLVTDHQPYFRHASHLIEEAGLRVQAWYPPIRSSKFSMLIGTGCERRQRRLGLSIQYLQCQL